MNEKAKHFGLHMLSVVFSAKGRHFFCIKVVTASYLSKMECINDPSGTSGPVILSHLCGHSLMLMNLDLVFPEPSLAIAANFLSCSQLL